MAPDRNVFDVIMSYTSIFGAFHFRAGCGHSQRGEEKQVIAASISYNIRPLHGFRRHLGCGAVAARITTNVWEILQLLVLTLI